MSSELYSTYLEQLINFENQNENLDYEKFEDWKKGLIEKLKDNYKAKLSQLEFYTLCTINEDGNISDIDDLPF